MYFRESLSKILPNREKIRLKLYKILIYYIVGFAFSSVVNTKNLLHFVHPKLRFRFSQFLFFVLYFMKIHLNVFCELKFKTFPYSPIFENFYIFSQIQSTPPLLLALRAATAYMTHIFKNVIH
jgi:hypothetical protein